MSKSTRLTSLLLQVIVPLAITAGLCWLLFTGIDFGQMVDVIRRYCDWHWIAVMVCINIVSHIVRALRWRLQLEALGVRVPLFAVVLSIFGTYAINLIFPRLGEVWRTGYIARRGNARFSIIFGSMVADRLADTMAVGILMLLTLALAGAQLGSYLGQNPDMLAELHGIASNPWVWLGAGVAVVLLWCLWLALRHTALMQKMHGMASQLWRGFTVVIGMPRRWLWLLLTVALWGCYFGGLYVAFFSFDFTTAILHRYGIVAVLVTFVLSSISMAVPSNGGIGPWQWAVMFALSFYSADIALPPGETFDLMSASFANMVMAAQTLLLILLGIFTFIAIALSRHHRARKAAT